MPGSKKFYFFCGLPRAGNTLLSTILNQNPEVAVGANSLVPEIFLQLRKLYTTEVFQNFPDADYFFVEANKDYYPFIEEKLLKKYKSKLFKCAAGKESNFKKLYISDVISSFHERENFKFG